MITTMFGFRSCWAETGALAMVVAVHKTTRAHQITLNMLMVAFLDVGCRSPGRSLRPLPSTDRVAPFSPKRKHASGTRSDCLAETKLAVALWIRYALAATCAYV